MQVYNTTLVQAPTLTAWKCDICGQSFYDATEVSRLDALVGATGPPPNRHKPSSAETNSTPAPDDSPNLLRSTGTE